MNQNFIALNNAERDNFQMLGAKIDSQTSLIQDKFCQLEMREMQSKIDALRQENSNLALAASQQAQTANIVSQLKAPCPVPSYIVPNPNCCYSAPYGYGYPYGAAYNNDGCGCGC